LFEHPVSHGWTQLTAKSPGGQAEILPEAKNRQPKLGNRFQFGYPKTP
jgi:hypothetical protein